MELDARMHEARLHPLWTIRVGYAVGLALDQQGLDG
jgi:hypothetical protein